MVHRARNIDLARCRLRKRRDRAGIFTRSSYKFILYGAVSAEMMPAGGKAGKGGREC